MRHAPLLLVVALGCTGSGGSSSSSSSSSTSGGSSGSNTGPADGGGADAGTPMEPCTNTVSCHAATCDGTPCSYSCNLPMPCAEVVYTPGSAQGTSTGGPVAAQVDLDAARCVLQALKDGTPSRHVIRHTDTTGSDFTRLWVVAQGQVVHSREVSQDSTCQDQKPRRWNAPADALLDMCIVSDDPAFVIDCLVAKWEFPSACTLEWVLPCPSVNDGG